MARLPINSCHGKASW